MMTEEHQQRIMVRACRHYGEMTQIFVCIEELSELTKELTKILRGARIHSTGVAEEAADVSIVLDEIIGMFGIEASVADIREKKLHRLEERIAAEERMTI